MKWARRSVTWVGAVLALATVACGSDDSGNSADVAASNTSSTTMGGSAAGSTSANGSTASNTTGAGGATTSTTAASGSGGSTIGGDPNQPPFNSTLSCGENNGLEWVRIVGPLAGEDYVSEFTPPSNIQNGRLDDQFGTLILEWDGSLELGLVVQLTGGLIIVEDGHSLARERLCITEGIFGAVPEAQQPPDAMLFRFQVTGARLAEDCSGQAIDVALDGCWYRDNTLLP